MKTLTFKVTDDDARLIRFLAKQENLSLSEYLRRRATAGAATHGPPEMVKSETSGVMAFSPPASEPRFGLDEVREILAHFP